MPSMLAVNDCESLIKSSSTAAPLFYCGGAAEVEVRRNLSPFIRSPIYLYQYDINFILLNVVRNIIL